MMNISTEGIPKLVCCYKRDEKHSHIDVGIHVYKELVIISESEKEMSFVTDISLPMDFLILFSIIININIFVFIFFLKCYRTIHNQLYINDQRDILFAEPVVITTCIKSLHLILFCSPN